MANKTDHEFHEFHENDHCHLDVIGLPRLRRVLSALPLFVPSTEVWPAIERWVEASVARGQRLGEADLLSASIAAENEGEIWSLDGDFARMARLGFVRTRPF